ncbi:MAG: beta-N-acetylhexosaminidase [Deltaproteobacteria bacterium]|nr:beta-N-acetylhexosaminidase [Deltaproteobacteria bacterium]
MTAGRGESAELAEAVGRLLLVGFEGRDMAEVEDLLTAVRPAGLIFFARNYPGEGGPEALRLLIDGARRLADSSRPLLVAIDHEGGPVQRLPAPYTRLPAARACQDLNEAERLAAVGARELAATGFNFNLAPVLDVPDGPEAFIGERGFSDDPGRVAAWGKALLAAYGRAGLLGAAKHFPGLGPARLDPHEELPVIRASRERLSEVDFQPYRELGPDLAAVMTSHALYPALDPRRPATLSPVVADLLKRDLGFGGALLTDDMEMGAITRNYDLGEAAVTAVAAGHDLVLVCRRRDNIEKVRQALGAAVRGGLLTSSRLADAFRRTENLTARLAAMAAPGETRAGWFKTLISQGRTE